MSGLYRLAAVLLICLDATSEAQVWLPSEASLAPSNSTEPAEFYDENLDKGAARPDDDDGQTKITGELIDNNDSLSVNSLSTSTYGTAYVITTAVNASSYSTLNDMSSVFQNIYTTTGRGGQQTTENISPLSDRSLDVKFWRDDSIDATVIPKVESGLLLNGTTDSGDTTRYYVYVIDYFVLPIILAIGLFGNVMTLVVLRHRTFRIMSTIGILCALSISDTILILMTPFNKALFQRLVGLDARGFHWLGCKIFFWVWRCAKMTSSWFIVLISLERFIVINYPMKARSIITRSKIVGSLFLTYASVFIYNGARTSFSDVVRNGECLNSVPDDPVDSDMVRTFSISSTALCTHIPVMLVLLFNLVSVYQLARQSRKRRNMTSHQPTSASYHYRSERQVSGMLLGITLAFLVLLTPIAVLQAMTLLRGISLYQTTDAVFVAFRQVAMTLEQLNGSINFYLYVLCSREFRKQFTALMCCVGRSAVQGSGSAFAADNNPKSSILSLTNMNSEQVNGCCNSIEQDV